MGCEKLHTDFFNFLEVIHRKNVPVLKKNRLYGDHLGNVRLSYQDKNNDGTITASTEIVEENNYYPFGLKHKGYNNNINGVADKYHTYNGKELNESLGINIYEMDVRSYDPALARFTSIDPVTHFDYSTYNAFDNNPVFWADPSGADAQNGDRNCPNCDENNQPYIVNGRYRTHEERRAAAKGDGKDDNLADKAAIEIIKKVATFFLNGDEVSDMTESTKQLIFKSSEIETIGVLLWEFATGTGRDSRTFKYGKHPFASMYFSGRIIEELNEKLSKQLRNSGYKKGDDFDFERIGLEFSPTLNPASWGKSLVKHKNSNLSQFFVGGAVADVKIYNNNLIIIITNETSRNSLMGHIPKNYNRDGTNKGHNKPLSTIKQKLIMTYSLNNLNY